jgi:hypothetical protein
VPPHRALKATKFEFIVAADEEFVTHRTVDVRADPFQ